MDQNSENIHDFEALLRNMSSKKPLALYTSSEHKNKLVNSPKPGKVSAKEVLASVSRQVKALQNADTASYKRVGNNLDKYKKGEFLPMNMMPVDRVVLQKQTKFETQCVTDTQLINVIENAEIVDKNRGVTQEFDKTFCENGDNDIDDKLNDSRLKPETITDTGIGTESDIDTSKVLEELAGLNEQDSKLFDNSDLVTCEIDTITCYQNDVMADFNDDQNTSQDTQGFNKCVEIFDVSEEDAVSPVLNTNRKSSTPPLVVDLYTFEKFENLAIPIIEEHEDMTVAKNMINSQIIGRQILIPAHNYDMFGRDSPVLCKIDCITTHLNKEDEESICTCSNNCIEEDVKCANEPTTDNIILTSENKKTLSKIVKTEIKDEILFSSDEEYEYLHKHIQELPLTCALETSFYDKSDVLDKTMYVGFHTASNKSIQINTDSLTRAKSILSDVDSEGTGTTLSDLVEIFDTGKTVSEHTQSVKLTSNKLEGDTDNNNSTKIEHSHETLERPSKTLNEIEENKDDMFECVSLPALERDKDANDDIVMSQIVNFKSISNSIMCEEKVSDTFDDVGLTALEQNKETDDDIMMSQVISFKSISRTPKFAANVSHESSQLSKIIAKRKLEGFKTASNKMIKLSDKTLARCKKVFQDIGLEDSEYESSKSNFTKTQELFHEDFKSNEFSSSNDASKTRFEADHTTQEQENYVSDKIDSYKNISEDFDSESDLQVKEKQPGIEDVDLQINDQTILQEFEENEMPLEETNNNAYVNKANYNNTNMSDSGVAIAASKNVFQDIMSSTVINSESTMNTAESFIDRSDKCEIVFKKPAANLRKAANKRTKSSAVSLTNIKSDIPEDDHETCDIPPTEFIGFKTASHEPIIISEQAREITRAFYRDLDEEITPNGLTEGTINSNTGKKNINKMEDEFNCGIDTQDFLAEELIHIEELFKDNIGENEKPTSPIFQGFQTASKKPIAISDRALEKSKKLFEIEISDTIQNDFSKGNTIISDLQPANANSENTNTEAPMLAGFKTADADRTKNLLKEIKDDDLFDTDFKSTSDPITSRFGGFQTASNKKINISAKALAKSKLFLNDFELKVNNSDNDDCDKEITHHLDSHFEGKGKCFKENDFNNEPCRPSTSKFIGFQTASNKADNVSKEALAKSKQIFQDVDIFDKECETVGEEITTGDEKSGPVFKGFQTASNKQVSISEKALQTSKKLFRDGENSNFPDNSPVFQGFQTASNKKVNISEKALAHSKKLFEDMNLSQFNKDPKTVTPNGVYMNKATAKDIIDNVNDTIVSNDENKFEGFQTASNKTVKVSEQSLVITKDLFKDIHVEQGNDDSAPVFRGFQTASNKPVQISEKALAMSKKLFEDINVSQFNTDPKTAAQTGVINDIKAPIINNYENKFAGFQTASKKKVTVSDQALARTRSILNDIDIDEEKDILNEKAPVFKGFQTASNKTVAVSEKALGKSKKLFEDINFSQIEDPTAKADLNRQITKTDDVVYNIEEPDSAYERKNNFGGFQTANNKKVQISEQALAKTRHVFKDIHADKENDSLINVREIKTPDLKANVKLIISKNNHAIPITSEIDSNNDINRDVIDTQVLNDFECTLNTEDFSKSTPVSKRSGSPILSCPRAKKRKFETPYSTSKKIEPRNAFVPPTLAKTYNFNKDYKKHKKYRLKDVVKFEDKHRKVDIDPYISEFNFDGLLNFVFNGKRNDCTDGKMTMADLKRTFLDSVNKKIVPEGWLDNHIKLIIWKLLSYEVKFPNVMKNTCTVRNVLEQLKYRYDRELYHVERPILRKILEKDEVPSKTMVLCVVAIYVDNVSGTSVPPLSQNVELLLTDGWYCVKACLDRMLITLVVNRAIVVGTKIAVCGAELINCEQGISPWEDTSSVRLKLHGNSARRARWPAPLGARADVIPCALGAARAHGGRAAMVRLALTRVYPVLTVERLDGSTVTLSERLENIRQMKYESERQAITERLYEEVEKEMSDLESQDSEGYSQKGCMDSGSQLAKCMKKCKDPDEYRSHLTKSQSRMLEDHASRQREKLAERVRERFQEKLQKYGLKTERNVVPLLKVRVADFTEKAGSIEVTKGYLSIWRPSAAVMELVTEGAWIEISNVIPTGIRNSEIQLSTGRQTVFNPYKQKNEKFKLYANTLQRKCYEIKEIAQNPSMTTDYNEIDTVGMIFCIEPSTIDFHEQSFQNVYLADADKNMICVNFWGGLKKFGYENVLDTGQIITCVNLQKRAGNTRNSIPQYRVTEFSYFTKTPKNKKALEMTNELTNKLSKTNNKFCEDCIALKNNYSIFKTRNNENVSPYRFDYNIPKKVSPCDANLNLTGLDFESSFNSQDISPQALLRKRKVNEKIEKLRLNYGEPPPLSSIHIINKSENASAMYKSPLLSNLERSKSPLQNVASPVSVNRTFVKKVNPVKLDFSNDLSESVDHFAEDFDASPPLSLDSDVVYK